MIAVALPPAPPAAVVVCAEDEPCWTCDTMGNGLCSRDSYVRVQRTADGHWRLVKRSGGVRWLAPLAERIAVQGAGMARATETTLYAWRTR